MALDFSSSLFWSSLLERWWMNQTKRNSFKSYWPWFLIVAASAAAHLWCMKSQFYLDDLWQIRDNGTFHGDGYTEDVKLRWFYMMLKIQVALFGMSSPAIHACNWLLHTGVALVLWRLALLLLPQRPGVALFSALLFAVHPLGSEIPNYARCQDIAWVTLFSLAACHQAAAFLLRKHWWHLCFALVMMAGATFSKGPGVFHVSMMVGVVAVCVGLPIFLQKGKRDVLCLVSGAALLLVCGYFLRHHFGWDTAVSRWQNPRIIGHAFTLSRVFWEFCRLGFWPIGLCADHHIQETLAEQGFWQVKDAVAWWAMAGMAVLVLLALVMMFFQKSRLVGLCLGLFVGAILMRFAFFVPEFMPEYRIYPGMPWFCLGVGILFAAAWRWMSDLNGAYPASLILFVLVVISAKRSHEWHSLDTLMADVLKKYPANARAIWVLQRNDIERGKWQAVIDRHKTLPQLAQKLILQNQKLAPIRALPTGHHALAEVGCTGLFARAVAEVYGADQGMMVIDALEIYM